MSPKKPAVSEHEKHRLEEAQLDRDRALYAAHLIDARIKRDGTSQRDFIKASEISAAEIGLFRRGKGMGGRRALAKVLRFAFDSKPKETEHEKAARYDDAARAYGRAIHRGDPLKIRYANLDEAISLRRDLAAYAPIAQQNYAENADAPDSDQTTKMWLADLQDWQKRLSQAKSRDASMTTRASLGRPKLSGR